MTKRVVWLAATLAAIELLYVVVVNLVLLFGLRPLLNRHPDTFLIGYERAYTLWPGVAHVERFRLRDQGPTLQWQLEIDQADVTIDLLDLVGKTFSATRVRATGVAFRLRRRLDDAGAATPRAAALAPIEGFDDPPLKPIGPEKPPESDADYDSWRVHLADVEVDAHEVWIEEHRLTGGLRVTGGLYIIPDRLVHVGNTTLDVDRGELRIGEHVALSAIDAHVKSILGAIDLRGPADRAVREISGKVRIDARTPSLDFLRLYLGSPPVVRLEDGRGTVHIDGILTNGRVMPTTVVKADCDHVVIEAKQFTVTTDYHAEVRVENASPEPVATGDLRIHRATVSRAGALGAAPTIDEAKAHFTGLPRDLAGPVEIERTELDVPANVPDLRWLFPAQGPGERRPVTLTGAAAIRARVDVDRAMIARGSVEVGSQRFAIKAPSFEVSSALASTAHFHDADWESRSLVLAPSVARATGVTVTRDGRAHAGGSLQVDVTEGRVVHGDPRDFALALAAKAPDLRWLTWRNPAEGDPRLTAHTATLNVKLRIPRPARLIDGTKEEAAITGSIGLAGTGDAGFKDTTLAGDVEATAVLQRLDLGRHVIEIRAVHAITRELTTYHGLTPSSGWWGRFDVSQLDVQTKSSMTLDLHGEARCKDGRPFNALLASEGVFPRWVGKLFPMEGLAASANLRRDHEHLDLGLAARGSSANVTVRLHDIGKKMDGAVKVDTKLVSIGVGFTEGKSHVKVFAGEEWLNAQIAEANAKEAETNAEAPPPRP
ncbi:MAG: hypothetical protein ABJE95_03455 [Byssovorax sp.]